VLPEQTPDVGSRVGIRYRALVVVLAAAWLLTPAASSASTQYGALTFPADESAQPASWDYWWGAARIVTTSGRRYIVGAAYTSIEGDIASGYQVFPLQGPYEGQGIMSVDGPTDWGSPSEPAYRFVHYDSLAVPGTSPNLQLDTFDTSNKLKLIDRWTRIPDTYNYRLAVNQADAQIDPTGKGVRLGISLLATMRHTPLLAGGTGRWFYNVPEDFGYPSRGYQYMQAAARLTGTLDLQQPDGSILHEQVDPERSKLLMIHESDPAEDIPAGLGLALATQLNSRYPQYYNLQWPWELVYADLGNGASLLFDLQGYHDTPNGVIRPLTPNMPTYRVLATLQLPDGESVALNSQLNAQHLSTRDLPDIAGSVSDYSASLVVQAWQFRVSFPGGMVNKPNGGQVYVPPFDLGLTPPWSKELPEPNAAGQRLVQRVPLNVTGWYAGCPVDGFAWSELLVNWYGWQNQDPWYTGGSLPETPRHCMSHPPAVPTGTAGNLDPPPSNTASPDLGGEGCQAMNPGTPTCTYTATHNGGIGGDASAPGGWTVTIKRPAQPDAIVISSDGGFESYQCGTIKPGDVVTASATAPDSGVFPGDPGICY
jgi:hypothetical protein